MLSSDGSVSQQTNGDFDPFVPPWVTLPTMGLRLLLSSIVDFIFLIDVVLQFITMYPRPTQSGVVWEQKARPLKNEVVILPLGKLR